MLTAIFGVIVRYAIVGVIRNQGQAMPSVHPLERRSTRLAGAISTRVAMMSESLMASQGRVPFKTKLSEAAALEWWQRNRYTEIGAHALSGLNPLAIANLDQSLTQYAQQKEAMGLPTITEPSDQSGMGM